MGALLKRAAILKHRYKRTLVRVLYTVVQTGNGSDEPVGPLGVALGGNDLDRSAPERRSRAAYALVFSTLDRLQRDARHCSAEAMCGWLAACCW